MPLVDLTDWIDDFSGPKFAWYVKRLSGNDTLANGSHQAGPYVPKTVAFSLFPSINSIERRNPDSWFDLYVDSHPDRRRARIVYYNNRFHGNARSGRDEARITNLGGASSAILDPDSTGALCVFAFSVNSSGLAEDCHVWVCDNGIEEDLIESITGPIEPGKWAMWSPNYAAPSLLPPVPPRANCWLEPSEIPSEWLARFPNGEDIIRKTVELRSDSVLDPDHRLIRRRQCEYELFRSLEEAVELPVIKAGFSSIDEFIARAQTILQRRKNRSGRSLELHTREIFVEEQLREGIDFEHGVEAEPGRRPDFLFPTQAAYRNATFPGSRLRMLAVKTTCRDRWRQILNEADRIQRKHLLTLQEGVSESQFREMVGAGVQLVVPTPIVCKYPKSVRPHLQSLESFLGDVRLLSISS